ncbi:hypothetical protein O0L34_g8492 [Tuta absoluta]|nr:hypothetical protein O0L34_g8492 [Tuta absoluta]
MSLPWTTIARWDTGYSADSVEWCPVEGFRDVLACATYQLFKEEEEQPSDPLAKQKRLGRIYLFAKIGHDTTELNPIQTIDTSGILDQKWCHHEISGFPILAVVTSDGKLQLYKLVKKEDFELEFWLETSIGQNILALSLDWSSNRSKTEPKIVVSDSAGSVNVFKVDNGLEAIGTWISHGFEAWIAAFDYWNTDVFYSGGDDCAFKSYDLRVPEVATSTNRKSHDAGVTTIRSHVDVEHQLLTGSYDERVRVWDARSLKTCVSETDVSGGVWRLKWHPYKHGTILAACMYGGFRILELVDEMKVVAEYLEHESIAYGADWKFDENKPLVATCSFYDCKMHISQFNLSKS